MNILEKGPSFVNADPKELTKLCLLSKASLQLVTDQLKRQNVSETALNEFKGGVARVIDQCEELGGPILKRKKLPYKVPSKNIVITPTDKST